MDRDPVFGSTRACMKARFTPILAGWLLAIPLAGQEVRFEGTGTPLPTNMVVTLRAELARLVASHRALFRRQPAAEFKIVYHLTRTHAEYAARAEGAGHAPRGVPGFTRTKQRWVAEPTRRLVFAESTVETWREQGTNDLMAVLLHESAHAVTAGFLGATPLWFTEGSAELLGTPAAGHFKRRHQEEPLRWRILADLIESGRMPPVRQFLEADSYGAWDRLFHGQRAHAYMASYSLFFLFSAQPALFAYLTGWLDTKALDDWQGLNRAFADYLDQRWPGGLAGFEQVWHRWICARAAAVGVASRSAIPSKPARP